MCYYIILSGSGRCYYIILSGSGRCYYIILSGSGRCYCIILSESGRCYYSIMSGSDQCYYSILSGSVLLHHIVWIRSRMRPERLAVTVIVSRMDNEHSVSRTVCFLTRVSRCYSDRVAHGQRALGVAHRLFPEPRREFRRARPHQQRAATGVSHLQGARRAARLQRRGDVTHTCAVCVRTNITNVGHHASACLLVHTCMLH